MRAWRDRTGALYRETEHGRVEYSHDGGKTWGLLGAAWTPSDFESDRQRFIPLPPTESDSHDH